MLTPKERGTQKVVEAMEELGYMTTFTCLNSLTYGLPQSRKRCYGVSAKLRSYGAAGKTTVAQQMNAVWAITKRLECGVVEPLTRLWEHRQTLTPDDSESICKTKAISKSGLPWCSGIVYRLWVSCVNTFFCFRLRVGPIPSCWPTWVMKCDLIGCTRPSTIDTLILTGHLPILWSRCCKVAFRTWEVQAGLCTDSVRPVPEASCSG